MLLPACVRRAPVALLSVLAVLAAGLVAAAPAQAVSANLVISQVYGGGGNAGATFTHDYIEIFNRGTTGAPLNAFSLQYASAAGTGNFGANSTAVTELPDVTLEPGQYYMVREASGATGSAPPEGDLTDPTPINMSGTAGKVAIVNGDSSLGCNGGSTTCDAAALARIVDLVGYGAANFSETAPAPVLSNSTAALRARQRLHRYGQQQHGLHGGYAGSPHHPDHARSLRRAPRRQRTVRHEHQPCQQRERRSRRQQPDRDLQ